MGEFVRRAALALLDILSLLLLLRAVFSWISRRPSKFDSIIYTLTEPILIPFRLLFSRFRFAQSFPLDLSFLAAIITIQLLSSLLMQY